MSRVLHLITSVVRGGIEKWLLSMLRMVPADRCRMDICCKGADVGPLAPVARQLGAKVFLCPLGVTHLPFVRGLRRLLTEGEYGILHNHLDVYSGLAVWVAHRARVPVVTTFHNTSFPPQTRWTKQWPLRDLRRMYGALSIRYALRHADLVTGVSQGVLRALDSYGCPGRAPCRMLPLAVEVPPPSPRQERIDFRRALGLAPDAPLVGHVGRLIEAKNHAGLLAVFQRVLRRVPRARLLIVGDGPLQETVRQMIGNMRLQDKAFLLGLRDDVPALLAACDVFLFPSLHEGLPVVALEAGAAGLPVVGSRVPGLSEAVQHQVTGLLHEVQDVDGLADSVVRLLCDKGYARRLGDAARQRVSEQFSTEASAAALLAVYDSLAPGGRPGKARKDRVCAG